MKLPIRNYTERPLTLFIEPYCDQYELPPNTEAIITLSGRAPERIDWHPDDWVSVWDEGTGGVVVEISRFRP